MNDALSQLRFSKRQIRQSVLTLLVFFVTLFSHADHLSLVEVDSVSSFELHDCHLCQQGIDSATNSASLYLVTPAIFINIAVELTRVDFTSSLYVSPPLRAPPKLL